MQVVAVALEHRVLLDMDFHIQVARGAAVDARLAIARRTDAHALVDAGGNLHFQRLLRLQLALAVALGARLGDVLAGAVALGASLLHREEALRHAYLARAMAGRAGFDAGAGLGAIAVAMLALVPVGHADLRIVAVGGLLQRDFHAVAQVGAAVHLRAAATASAASLAALLAKNIAEDVAEGFGETAVPLAAAAEAARHVGVDAGMAVLVVGGLLLGVREHLVGLFDLLELLFGILAVRIAVRVVLHRQLAIGLLDLVIAGVLAHPEHFVKVTFCHGGCLPDGPGSVQSPPGRNSKKAERGIRRR
ncbi:hypothetical protein CS8_053260 [Cupriavidus sp. 8B]